MPERSRPSAVLPGLTAADVERQLEGRAEVLAAARRPYAELEKALSGRRWRRALTRRPELVPALVAEAPAVEEALDRVQRRAAQEAWPDDTPVWKAARELSARRERLTRLARRRLDVLTVAPEGVSLEEALRRLDALVRQEVRWALKPGEVLVFEHDAWRQSGPSLVPRPRKQAVSPLMASGWAALGALGFLFFLSVRDGRELLLLLLLTGMVVGGALLLGTGRLRLTSERLIWAPLFGEPQEVRLGTIAPNGLRLEQNGNLHVEGDRRLHSRSFKGATAVALLVELHRQPPLRGAARAGVRLDTVAVFPAKLGEQKGFCVLGPQGLSFIPEGRGSRSLRAVTGHPSALSGFDSDLVLDALRWLPEAEFDACVMRMVEATGGVAWSRTDARYVPGAPVWRRIRIERGGLTLTGRVEWDQQDAADWLLRDWPR
ncbi:MULTISPECIES: hypothetical protein [unclassified Corallococcus]|uniref:hypothetical protein n=1 Tax=unclassified Corallococcus TaxID=2685029 RepID=UPI001A8D7CD9|nr:MULTISPECIES: hypothetical protein [unclassified Corallococcus]MBN9682488.1 hypothetical protein [Corallococcus sp. NCSPR001]WAS85959.1 hypothetical protein O0N60_03075 [Corallococcus sp. NCRR]